MTATKTISDIAREASGYFESGTREPEAGASAVRILKNGAPEWIRDAIHEAHGSMMPDDYVYDISKDAFRAIADADSADLEDLEELGAEFADRVDIYTAKLCAWLGSSLHRLGYCDEAAEEFGGELQTMSDRLMQGQYLERSRIFSAILSACEAQAEQE